MAKIRGLPEVAAVAPYARGMVMLQLGNRPAFPAGKLPSGRAFVACKRAKMVKPRCRSHAIRRKEPAASPYADRSPDDLPDRAPGWRKGKMAGRGWA